MPLMISSTGTVSSRIKEIYLVPNMRIFYFEFLEAEQLSTIEETDRMINALYSKKKKDIAIARCFSTQAISLRFSLRPSAR